VNCRSGCLGRASSRIDCHQHHRFARCLAQVEIAEGKFDNHLFAGLEAGQDLLAEQTSGQHAHVQLRGIADARRIGQRKGPRLVPFDQHPQILPCLE
jgi:hypothetical protein